MDLFQFFGASAARCRVTGTQGCVRYGCYRRYRRYPIARNL